MSVINSVGDTMQKLAIYIYISECNYKLVTTCTNKQKKFNTVSFVCATVKD